MANGINDGGNDLMAKGVARKRMSMLVSLICERDSEYSGMADEVMMLGAMRRERVKAMVAAAAENSGKLPLSLPRKRKGKGKRKRKLPGTELPGTELPGTELPTVLPS